MSEISIRVMIVDDHPMVRSGLATMLSDQGDIEVVAEASDGEQAVALFQQHRPDVTLLDLRLPKRSGVEVIQQVRREFTDARFIVITTYDGDEDIVRAIHAGAYATLLKDSFGPEIISSIRSVHAGNRLIPLAVADRLAESQGQTPALSPREHQTLVLIARGDSNKEIANALGISEGTVKTYVVKIFAKLGVSDRTAATTVAMRQGIIRL